MGDAVLAFFGAPVAHEDDPQRAVLAALDMVAAIGLFRQEIRKEMNIEFGVRIGITPGGGGGRRRIGPSDGYTAMATP